MRFILEIILAVSFLSTGVFGQERATRMVAGPSGDMYQVLVSFLSGDGTTEAVQAMIINVNRIREKHEQPTSFLVQITSTHRNLQTADKDQKVLGLKWEKGGDVEVKCQGGQWVKQIKGDELDSIVSAVNAVIKETPLDSPSIVEFALPEPLMEKVGSILDSLSTSKLICVRDGK